MRRQKQGNRETVNYYPLSGVGGSFENDINSWGNWRGHAVMPLNFLLDHHSSEMYVTLTGMVIQSTRAP